MSAVVVSTSAVSTTDLMEEIRRTTQAQIRVLEINGGGRSHTGDVLRNYLASLHTELLRRVQVQESSPSTVYHAAATEVVHDAADRAVQHMCQSEGNSAVLFAYNSRRPVLENLFVHGYRTAEARIKLSLKL